MLIREKMKNNKFSSSEKEVIEFILNNADKIDAMTTKEIGEAAFTSASTLVRIAHKLNYEGWNELKKAFLKEEEYLSSHFCNIDANIPFSDKDSYYEIAAKISSLKQESVQDTFALIDHKELHEAITLLKNARHIALFAVSNNALLAREFAHNMSRIKKHVDVIYLQGELVYQAAVLDPGSVAILLSYSGETPIYTRVIEQLRQNKIPIVSITGIGDNTVSTAADVSLRISTREKLYSKIGTFVTDASVSYLLDVLYAGVFRSEYKTNLERKMKMSREIEQGRISDVEIMKEDSL